MNLPDIFQPKNPVAALNNRLGKDLMRMPGHNSVLEIGSQLMMLAAQTGASELNIGPWETDAMRLRGGRGAQFQGNFGEFGVSITGPFTLERLVIRTPTILVRW